jgi:aminoglycoside phosphotransferase (APT) family kinase protein
LIRLAGLVRLGQGRAAEVFALDLERVIKVARAEAAESLDREAAALRAAHDAGMPVPSAHELLDVEGRRALIMDRVAGTDMLTSFAQRPWTLLRAGARLGRLHARLHQTPAPASLPSAREVIEGRIVASSAVPPAIRERILALLGTLPDGDRLCHFDFHPGNIITDGKQLTVIDWPGACRGAPLADVAATLIALRGGKTTPGTPWITRLFAPIGRKLLLGGYLRGYRAVQGIDPHSLARWRVVLAGVRLTYAIPGEDRDLLAAIERGARG